MTKKGQLISTIFLALFIAVMIPVAIFATTANGTTVTNRVQYYVTDLEGAFYYAITGNRLDKGTYSSFDVGYEASSGTITLLLSTRVMACERMVMLPSRIPLP